MIQKRVEFLFYFNILLKIEYISLYHYLYQPPLFLKNLDPAFNKK